MDVGLGTKCRVMLLVGLALMSAWCVSVGLLAYSYLYLFVGRKTGSSLKSHYSSDIGSF
ncbi:hypothetical protein V6Z11_A08G086400 [Gossypium hirsutum]